MSTVVSLTKSTLSQTFVQSVSTGGKDYVTKLIVRLDITQSSI